MAKYELLEIDEQGREIRDYGDGIRRYGNGQLVTRPENTPLITSENARVFHAQRKAKILHAIEAKLKDVTKTNAPAEAIAAIVGKRAAIAMVDDTRTGNDAAKIVLAAVDAYQDKAEKVTVTRNEYAIDAATMEVLERMMREREDATATRNDNVVDVNE